MDIQGVRRLIRLSSIPAVPLATAALQTPLVLLIRIPGPSIMWISSAQWRARESG